MSETRIFHGDMNKSTGMFHIVKFLFNRPQFAEDGSDDIRGIITADELPGVEKSKRI
jgi:hypothetical protein